LPKVGISPDNLRALIGRIDTLQKRTPAMEPLLTHLSLALNDYPRVELVNINWKIANSLDTGGKVAADARGAAGATPAAPAAAASPPAGVWSVIEISARLPLGMISDQRAQVNLIESFAARLRDPQTDVRILSRPFDIESDKPLKSAGEKSEAQLVDAPKFALRISRSM
jgi:hypothetical protein